MNLSVSPEVLNLELEPMERFWAFHLGKTITIPRDHIQAIGTAMPDLNWRIIRAPGTGLPGLIAGTFYTDRGREFWYITKEEQVLTLDLTAEDYYKRIILTVDDPADWVSRLESA